MPTTITDIINEDSSTYLTVNVDGVERQASIYKISAWRTGTPATSPCTITATRFCFTTKTTLI